MRSTITLLEGRVLRTVAIRGHKRLLGFIISLESDLWSVILQIPLLLVVITTIVTKHAEHAAAIECPSPVLVVLHWCKTRVRLSLLLAMTDLIRYKTCGKDQTTPGVKIRKCSNCNCKGSTL